MNKNLEQSPIVLIGGGGHARSLVAMAPEGYKPTCYVSPEEDMSLEWLGTDDVFLSSPQYDELPVIIGLVAGTDCNMSFRRQLIDRYSAHKFATIISSRAIVEPDCIIGRGSMVFNGAVVNTGAYLGNHVVINTSAVVEHDVRIGSNTFIGPGAIVCGGVNIGDDVYVGAGAMLRNGIKITDGAIIGMGAVVVKDIDQKGVYAGNPATRIK